MMVFSGIQVLNKYIYIHNFIYTYKYIFILPKLIKKRLYSYNKLNTNSTSIDLMNLDLKTYNEILK